MIRAAMHDAVPNGHQLDFLRFAQPIAGGRYCRSTIGDFLCRVGFVNQRRSITGFGTKRGRVAMPST